jgi:hypothetical protein
MRYSVRILAGLSAIAALAATGCTPAATRKAPDRASAEKPYDFRSEGTIPPANDRDATEEADVVEVPVAPDRIEAEEAEAPVDTTSPPAATPAAVHIDGFRVQIFASASKEAAEGARRTALERTRRAAYVEYVDGLYKVRMGNCRTREEAEKLLKELREHHYKDAWIVETKIEVPQGSPGTDD